MHTYIYKNLKPQKFEMCTYLYNRQRKNRTVFSVTIFKFIFVSVPTGTKDFSSFV